MDEFDDSVRSLPGISNASAQEAFIEQVVESDRRVRYVSAIRARPISCRRTDPSDGLFDPVKAAVCFDRNGLLDEAIWMVFYFVHFGRNKKGGWRYARDVYRGAGLPHFWDWTNTSSDPRSFRDWLHEHESAIRNSSDPGGFGNHRKYQSLSASSKTGTGAAFESYVRWVDPPRTHLGMINDACEIAAYDPKRTFRFLYESMKPIASFGRTARFDYLTMIGKLQLAPIEPDSTYMNGATGPLKGARLLFGVNEAPKVLDEWLVELDGELGLGMQVLEDSLCNWQKFPQQFKPFRG